jgi:hypothetical protein
MTSLIAKIIAGLVVALLLAVAVMWVVGLGPFNTRPSAAAKQIPKVAAAVTKTQGQASTAVAKVESKAKDANTATEKRTEGHVAKIRAAAPRAVPADVPDGEFFAGVCESKLYAGSADCRGFGGQPEGDGAPTRQRAVRGRAAPAT